MEPPTWKRGGGPHLTKLWVSLNPWVDDCVKLVPQLLVEPPTWKRGGWPHLVNEAVGVPEWVTVKLVPQLLVEPPTWKRGGWPHLVNEAVGVPEWVTVKLVPQLLVEPTAGDLPALKHQLARYGLCCLGFSLFTVCRLLPGQQTKRDRESEGRVWFLFLGLT